MNEEIRKAIRELLTTAEYPMKSTPQIVHKVTGGYFMSVDREYAQVYLELEAMCRAGEIYCVGVRNGGNVYMAMERIVRPVSNANTIKYQEAINLDNLPR